MDIWSKGGTLPLHGVVPLWPSWILFALMRCTGENGISRTGKKRHFHNGGVLPFGQVGFYLRLCDAPWGNAFSPMGVICRDYGLKWAPPDGDRAPMILPDFEENPGRPMGFQNGPIVAS